MNDFYNNNKKETLLTFLFVIALIILSVLIAVFYQKINATTDGENKIMQSYNVQLAITELVSNCNETEIKQRDFIFKKDSSTLSHYNLAVIKLQNSYSNLKKILKGEVSQQKNLKILNIYIKEKFQLLKNPVDLNSFEKFRLNTKKNKDVLPALLTHMNMMKGSGIFTLSTIQATHKYDKKLPPLFFLWTSFLTVLIISGAYWKIQSGYKKLKKTNNQLITNKIIYEYAEEIGQLSHFYKNIHSDKIYFSKNSYKMLGSSLEEFNHFTKYIDFVHPDDRHLVNEMQQKIIEGQEAFVYYFRIIRKDGELRYIKVTAKTISDLFKEKILMSIYVDITDELKRAKELEEKIFDLEISNKELSAFNYVASHDLQEPLRKVQLFVSRIKTEHYDLFPANLKQSFGRIEIATKRMERLINDLLVFSRTNKLNKEFIKTDLNDILKQTIQDFEELLKDKKTEIHGGILPTVDAIPFQMQQLFNNLISNSLKYAKENIPLLISISTKIVTGDEIPKLRNRTLKYYQISFADNGIGFDQEYAESIFTIFSRLHDESQYTGTGIGLAICKKIVDNHKGAISAEGLINNGAIFHVFLPV